MTTKKVLTIPLAYHRLASLIEWEMTSAYTERRVGLFMWAVRDGIVECIERAKQGVDSPVLRECGLVLTARYGGIVFARDKAVQNAFYGHDVNYSSVQRLLGEGLCYHMKQMYELVGREEVVQYVLDCMLVNNKTLALVLVAQLEQALTTPITGETNGDVPTR